MVKISAFPKCWIEDITEGRMDLFEWFDLSMQLDVEGLEIYEGFLTSYKPEYLRLVKNEALSRGMQLALFCVSPDFTVPIEEQKKEIEKQKDKIRAAAEMGIPFCRVLSGQHRENLSIQEGLDRAEYCITSCLPVAEENGVHLVIENHYKDGYWKYPEFAQKMDVFLQLVNRIDSPWFGIQFDPSNTIVAGEDPLELLNHVLPRVMTMHASDRYIKPGYDKEEVLNYLGKQGYHPALVHGVVGKGLNDYPTIFSKLKNVGFDGWISIEDGMNGMDEMKSSVDFLKQMRQIYFGY